VIPTVLLRLTADEVIVALYFNGDQVPSISLPNAETYYKLDNVVLPPSTNVIAVKLFNSVGPYGFIASSSDNRVVTNDSWKCTASTPSTDDWIQPSYDDSLWPQATQVSAAGTRPWEAKTNSPLSPSAFWIWTGKKTDKNAYCRLRI